MLTYLAFLINYQNSLCPQIFCLLDFACGILTVKVTQLVWFNFFLDSSWKHQIKHRKFKPQNHLKSLHPH